MLKIGFDAKRLFYNRTGLGNYSRTLVSNLQKFYPENHYYLFAPNKKNKIDFPIKSNTEVIFSPSRFINALWRSFLVSYEDKFKALDIYHGLSAELPFRKPKKIKYIVTIHDLIFLHYPKFYPAIDRKIYKIKSRKACHSADLIISISQTTKKDIVNFFNIKPEKIKVIYQSCNPIFRKKYTEEDKIKIKKKYHLPENFVLFVGRVEYRKNLLSIIEALNIMKEKINLVVIGKHNPKYAQKVYQKIEKYRLKQQIYFFQNVPFSEIPIFYHLSDLVVYPSITEGFGLPILEAFATETPILTSDAEIFKEIGSEAIVYAEPFNYEKIAFFIEKILTNKQFRNDKINKGKQRLKIFEPKKITEQYFRAYKELIS